MPTFFGIATHRIIYKAVDFAPGKAVTAYIWSPALVKSAIQTFTEVSDGIYYLDYAFLSEGVYFAVFSENGVVTIPGVFRINTISTQLADILADTGTDGVVVKATGLSADAVDKILDEVVEGTLTLRQAIRILLAGLAGISGGGGTAILTFRDVADAKARITATVDSSGNRTAITRDGT